MKPVFEYLEYRSYLKDTFDERKASNPFFSYRVLSESLGLDTSNLFRILHQEAHLPVRCQPQTLEFLGLSGRSAEYYGMLIAYARERGSKSKQEILEKALSLRDVSRHQLEEQQLATYFGNWWVAAIRSLLEVTEGSCVPSDLSRRLSPPVSEAAVEDSLKILEELGLVRKASSGRLVLAEAHVTAGGELRTKAVRQFQKQILALASESLERFAREERDVSTLTLALDASTFSQIREILRECRRQIQKCVEEAKKPDRVMQLSMAFFPLAPAEATSR
jgi:uncharacterized protein (TIGR02147 family)